MAFLSLTGTLSPLPRLAGTGHPNATATAVVAFAFSPLKQYAPNGEDTDWPNPLPMLPLIPLPGVPAAIITQAGYAQ